MIESFAFSEIPKLIFGPSAVMQLGSHTLKYGGRVLLVNGAGSLERSGQLHRIVDHLTGSGLVVHRYSVTGEPSPNVVDAAVKAVSDNIPDVVVAIGGGSVLDAGKAIAAMCKETGSVADFLEGVGTRTPSGQSVPMIAVPTTSGTGSEATKNAVISRVGRSGFKKSLRHDNYIPKVAILDPELCLSTPPSVTAACGMDAFTQLVESYVSTNASVLTDALAVDGMQHLIPALPDACGNRASDPSCRGGVAYGAFLSGVTLANAGLGVVHGVAGPMGGVIAIPHGVACANLLPAALRLTLENLTADDTMASRTAIRKFARIGRLFGAAYHASSDCCRHLVDCLYQWLEQFSIPRLGSFGLTDALADNLVRLGSNKNNPLPLSADQIRQMILDRF